MGRIIKIFVKQKYNLKLKNEGSPPSFFNAGNTITSSKPVYKHKVKYDDAFGRLQGASGSYCIGTISSYMQDASQTIAYEADHRLESVSDASKKRSDGIWRTLINRYEDHDSASVYNKYSENGLLSVIFQHNSTMSTGLYLAIKNAQGDIEAFLNESGEKVVE